MQSCQRPRATPFLVASLLFCLMACTGLKPECPEYPHDALLDVTFDSLASFGTAEAYEDWRARHREIVSQHTRQESLCGMYDGMVHVFLTQALGSNTSESSDTVQASGDYLIVLRDDRLFTIRIGPEQDKLEVVDSIEALPPEQPYIQRYDVLRVHREHVVLVGSDYGRNALGFFKVGADGRLSHDSTQLVGFTEHKPSQIYTSLIAGNNLILYMQNIEMGEEPYRGFSIPAIRSADSEEGDWTELLDVSQIVRPIQPVMAPRLHSMVRCNLAGTTPTCSADGFIAPLGDSFHTSNDALYVWARPEPGMPPGAASERANDSVVYRIPFSPDAGDASAGITAIRARGQPVAQHPLHDQHSLREKDGMLDAFVSTLGEGDDIYVATRESGYTGSLQLFRAPLSLFSREAPRSDTTQFTTLASKVNWPVRSRFVGEFVTWWEGSYRTPSRGATDLHMASVQASEATTTFPLPHGIDHIDSLKTTGAVVIGMQGMDLGVTSIRLGETPTVVRSHRETALKHDSKGYDFVFETGNDGAIASLPVVQPRDSQSPYGNTSMLFFRVDDAPSLERIGNLRSLKGNEVSDDFGCAGPCVIRPETSRPLFYRDRIFALMGYELVEGLVENGEVVELRRMSFLP